MERLIPDDADEDPDPDLDRPRPTRLLYVPVRLGSAGGRQLRLARTPLGARTAIGFTSAWRLAAALGEHQTWITLTESALRSLASPLGAVVVTVDPRPGTVPSSAAGPFSRPPLMSSALPSSAIRGRRPAPARLCTRRAMDLSEAKSL
jgi:hypothetical protein